MDQSNEVRYIKLDNDQWEDAGNIYKVIKSVRRPNSTAVELTIEHKNGHREVRVVPNNQIDWLSQ